MKQYEIKPGRGPTESPIQLSSFWAGQWTDSCPSLADTSICLNYSGLAAWKHKHKKSWALKWKERISPELLSIRQEKTAKRKTHRECAAGILQIQTCTRSAPESGPPQPERGAQSWGSPGGLIVTPIMAKLILGGASPLSRKMSNSDNKSRWYDTTVTL